MLNDIFSTIKEPFFGIIVFISIYLFLEYVFDPEYMDMSEFTFELINAFQSICILIIAVLIILII